MQNVIEAQRSGPLPLPEAVSQPLRGAVAIAILLVVFVTLTPFSDLADPKVLEPSSGNETATYLALLVLAGCAGVLLHQGNIPFCLVEGLHLELVHDDAARVQLVNHCIQVR